MSDDRWPRCSCTEPERMGRDCLVHDELAMRFAAIRIRQERNAAQARVAELEKKLAAIGKAYARDCDDNGLYEVLNSIFSETRETRERNVVESLSQCRNTSPPEFTGRWRDWHRGHGCSLDDGKPRTSEGEAEIAGILGTNLR